MSCWQTQAASPLPSCCLAASGYFPVYVVMLSRLMLVASPTGTMGVKPAKLGRILGGVQLCAACPPQALMLLLWFS